MVKQRNIKEGRIEKKPEENYHISRKTTRDLLLCRMKFQNTIWIMFEVNPDYVCVEAVVGICKSFWHLFIRRIASTPHRLIIVLVCIHYIIRTKTTGVRHPLERPVDGVYYYVGAPSKIFFLKKNTYTHIHTSFRVNQGH